MKTQAYCMQKADQFVFEVKFEQENEQSFHQQFSVNLRSWQQRVYLQGLTVQKLLICDTKKGLRIDVGILDKGKVLMIEEESQ